MYVLNFFLCFVFTIVILIFLVESFSFHPGLICSYSNVPYFIGLGVSSIIFASLLHKNIITINKLSIVIGLCLVILFYVIRKILEEQEFKIAKEKYNDSHTFSLEKIDKEKFKELLKDCETKNIEIYKRKCDCRCSFGDRKPINDNDCPFDCIDFEGNSTTNPKECFPLFGCNNVHCSVFNTLVDYKTDNVWCKQDYEEDSCDRFCLLTKLSKEEINELTK